MSVLLYSAIFGECMINSDPQEVSTQEIFNNAYGAFLLASSPKEVEKTYYFSAFSALAETARAHIRTNAKNIEL